MRLPTPRSRNRRAWPPAHGAAAWTPDSRWRLERSLDLTALGSHDFKTDGSTFTAEGVTFTSVNAGAAQTLAFTDGTGIEIAPDQATVFDHATKSAPFVHANLDALVSGYAETDRLLLLTTVKAAGLSEASQAYGLMVGSTQQPELNLDGAVGASYASGATQVRTWKIWEASTQTVDTAAAEPGVLALEWLPPAFSAGYLPARRWPRPGERVSACPENSAANFGPLAGTFPWSAATVVMRLWAERPGTEAAFTATFTGLRVLRQRL